MPDTNGWSARWYPSCGGATARAHGPNRGWIPVPGDNSGEWGPPTGSPNTPSQWCCTSSLLESFRLMYSTGRSSPPISWVRTAPSPRSDASVCSKKGREKSGECNSGPPHRAAFTWVKTCWHRSVHGTVSGTSFLVRSVSGLVSSE